MGLASRVLGAVLVIGAGAALFGTAALAPRILRATRPALRDGLKRGMRVYAGLRAAAAELAEDIEDLVAEVREEVNQASPRDNAADAPEAKQA